MSIKQAVSRDDVTFGVYYTYRELTYKLATRLVNDPPTMTDDEIFEHLKGEAKEVEPVRDVKDCVESLGLAGYELSKVETYVIPTTLNTVWRGVATKGDREVRFYVETP